MKLKKGREELKFIFQLGNYNKLNFIELKEINENKK